ncbi:MAG: hypothetical protein A2700_02840 [Candidatus Blackburnbacteria bacterium RIFCSPHIGHO2_01_FULL_44_64]|uniref:Cell division protein FtsB n=1 Tax=Candidatus Blackburnbacteria bacterium RIFCSPHIGHO2_02_FULL_44_20 TaxID=1797516 RepID=A0A1G1V425_9BACT|nr:MAG: hypothetical protein A2700_02840 [Candidatus Blackburnbacteria bacterium RIFCSPHIGHO2_01_FULL_44_64]OGY10131.1 MAG: hypothetical protein A3D26_00910 [Candidatus Blackburnbacteria bacterium RIFCSPHIGHO2_02_FULL_44_20]OGY10641.1 MAG: hypothetical protein A3E16_02365 [Candidatus Blackburnbacteria bacterium RIFCSPHIGHO2_12_FULL_44_25]OGY15330.1 MAG: hypothetical protein A3A62_01600 [Candidatus Blackburnbacteria bacterium RIFCSPLOWO2_01_FULL_44_43]OGY15481.1 MAG: hypothetical protein A3H88_0
MSFKQRLLGNLTSRGLVLVVVLLTISSLYSSFQLFGRGGVLEEAELMLEEVQRENRRLSDIQANLGSVEFIEREARDKLGLVAEGETVVVLPDGDTLRRFAPLEDTVEEEFEPEKRPIWGRWLRLFLPELEKVIFRG